MAFDDGDVPASVRDILDHMPREMRQRVLADYETHYAPFLTMLAGWKGAVQQHYAFAQEASLARLQEQFFPLGNWRFPPQILAVPQRAVDRTTDLFFETPFSDPEGRTWLPCGDGWLQPTSARDVSVRPSDGRMHLTIEGEVHGDGPLDPLLRRGQLAFVAAPEDALTALDRATWWVMTPDSVQPRRAVLTRYEGYLEFEREMQTARVRQRQMDLWLPPCYPYGRKIICLQLAGVQEGPPPELAVRPVRQGFRFVGIVPAEDRRGLAALEALQGRPASDPLIHLNAFPAVQTAVSDSTFYPPFPRVGQEQALRLTGSPDVSAAAVLLDGQAVPAAVVRLPSADPTAAEPDVEVRFSPAGARVARVKVYHGSRGQGQAGGGDTPTLIAKPPLRCAVPFPMIGGASVGGPENRADWVRTAWYHSVLRPPLLTEGDLLEIIRQRQEPLGEVLRFRDAVREVITDVQDDGAHWRSYLWPSMLARATTVEGGGEIPSPRSTPLVQNLRITFERGAGAWLPDFLLPDIANYLASVLSQQFILSCFQVEGRMA